MFDRPKSSFDPIVSNSKAFAAVRYCHIVDLRRVRADTRNILLPARHRRRERLLSMFLTVGRVFGRGELVDERARFDFIYGLAYLIRCAVRLLYLDGLPRLLTLTIWVKLWCRITRFDKVMLLNKERVRIRRLWKRRLTSPLYAVGPGLVIALY